jgi:hypothetical protein
LALSRRIFYPLTIAIILAYFLFFTHKSLFIYFDNDDMYNLYIAWSKPLGQVLRANLFFWNGPLRPMGAIFYRAIFAAAGFNPVPFRIAALGLCIVNIALCFWFARLVSGSERTAALAALIFAFHTRLMDVWFRTAVIYDVLCFTFVYLTACLYISARRDGGLPGFARIAAILVCFTFALDAKEMAVCLPVLLLGYELIFHTSKLQTFLGSRAAALIAVMDVMTIVYAIGKLRGPDSMANNPYYKPDYSYNRFEQTWNVYLSHLFVLPVSPRGWVSMTILSALLGIALAALAVKSRTLLFAWIVIFFGLLPVSFAPVRGGFVIYVSYVGWVLYVATALVAIEDLMTRRHPQYRTALACLVFVMVGWRFGRINLRDQRADPRRGLYAGPALVRSMAGQLRAMQPALPAQARILFVEDSFTTGEWTPLFIVQLLYNDPTLIVNRVKIRTAKPANWDQYRPPSLEQYDYVFTYEDGRYRQLKPS